MAEEKKKKSGGKRFKIFLAFVVIGVALWAVFTFWLTDVLPASDYAYLVAGACVVLGIVAAFMFGGTTKKASTEAKTTAKTAEGVEMDIAVNAKFLSFDELKTQHGIITATWSQLPALKKTGIVFQNSMINGKYTVGMKDEYHCLVIGATASGKTHLMIVPALRILAHTGEKPNIVVSDPKGELFTLTSNILKEEGYKVYKYDLRDPFNSSRWNPMSHAYDVFHEAKNFSKNIKKCSNGDAPEKRGFQRIPNEKYGNEWYGFNGVAYPNLEQLKAAVASAEQMYTDQAFGELKEIAATLCPQSKANDPTWEEGAKTFLYACMLAMLEDSAIPELGMTREKFNFYNLFRITQFKDDDADNPFDTLKKYLLEGRNSATSDVPQLASGIIAAPTNTAKSYLSVLLTKIQFLQDMGIAYLTSDSDLNFDEFTDQPSVFYLVIPDDKEERYPLANLCISQLYKRLVDKANTYVNNDRKLPRHVYFILDEFGNMPPIPKFESMITVARGRNILFELAIQSYTQLETKYGKESADTIKGNCNAQIFIGTDDQNTRDDFSKRCGDVQLIYEEESTSTSRNKKNNEQDSTNTSKSFQRTTRALITPYELGQLPFGTVVVKLYRFQPLKVKLTGDFDTPFFHQNKAITPPGVMKSLDKEKIYYDIKLRNKKILKS